MAGITDFYVVYRSFPFWSYPRHYAMNPRDKLPLKEYFSRLSYLSCLLTGSFIFLPRPSSWLINATANSAQRSSTDRPEHPFLTPLTADPLATMLWDVLGTLIIMIWWGHHLRSWWEGPVEGCQEGVVNEKEVDRRQNKTARTLRVRSSQVAIISTN